jgi:hypothetical protein
MKSLLLAASLFMASLFGGHHAANPIPATPSVAAVTLAENQLPASPPPAVTLTPLATPSTHTDQAITTGTVLGIPTQTSYVTHDELAALSNNLRALIYSVAGSSTTAFTDPQIAADGNGVYYGEAAAPVTQLSNITVNGISGLTAADIPALNYFPASSTISIAYGGTGTSTAPTANKLLFSDANGNWEYAATSSLGISGIGTLASIGPTGQTQIGPTITLATSTNTTNGLTSALTITAAGNIITLVPSLSGLLTVSGGGTGSTTLSGLLKGNGTGSILSAVAGIDYQAPITASYPIQFSSNALSLAFGTSTNNTWASTQTFTNAPVLSNFSGLIAGNSGATYAAATSSATAGTAISFLGSGAMVGSGGLTINFSAPASSALSIPFASSTALTATTLYSTLASTTNLNISGIAGALLKTVNGVVSAAAAGTDFENPLTFTYPLMRSTNTISLALGTTTTNNWSQLQTFNGGFLSGASSTVNGNFTVTGTDTHTGIGTNSLLYNNASQQLAAATIGNGLTFSGGALSTSFGTTTANSFAALQQFANASTSLLSVYGPAYFGGTATSSFNSVGVLSLVSNGLTVGNNQLVASGGNVGIGTTSPFATLSVNGLGFFSGNLTASNIIATGTLSVTGTGTSTFSGGSVFALSGSNVVIGTTTANHEFDVWQSNNAAIGLTTTDPALTVTNAGSTIGNGSTVAFQGVDANGTEVTLARIADISTSLTAGAASGNLAFYTRNAGSQQQDLTILSGGKVGIGTTSPTALLSVSGGDTRLKETVDSATALVVENAAGTSTLQVSTLNTAGNIFQIATSSGSTYFDITGGGNVGVGTATPYSALGVWGPDTASSTSALAVVNSASTTLFAVFDGGNAQLSGTLTQSSDQRLKQNIQSLDGSSTLALIDQLNPVTFNWIDPNQGSGTQVGFIAQQVQAIFPSLVSTTSATTLTPGGTLGLNYIGLISPIVSAVQTLSSEVQAYAESFVSNRITATQKLCVGSTCVTPAQFQAMVAAANASQSSSPSAASVSVNNASTTSDTPPTITINGDNPAVISVGDSYADLGATAIDANGHSLDIETFLNGDRVSSIMLDPSEPATDTIDYVATDSWGNTATGTRTVSVEGTTSTASQGAITTQP